MCRGAIAAPMEANPTQKGQPRRMHGPGLWKYKQNEQCVTPFPLSGGNCNLWCQGWDSIDIAYIGLCIQMSINEKIVVFSTILPASVGPIFVQLSSTVKPCLIFQCSFGNQPCNANDAIKKIITDQGYCLSFNPGNH